MLRRGKNTIYFKEKMKMLTVNLYVKALYL